MTNQKKETTKVQPAKQPTSTPNKKDGGNIQRRSYSKGTGPRTPKTSE